MKIYGIEMEMEKLALDLKEIVETLKARGVLSENAEFWSVSREQWATSEINTTWRVAIGYGQKICASGAGNAPLPALYQALAEIAQKVDKTQEQQKGKR